jgi:peptidoglycan/xylan/chitin deacetylase (PgdA/CDA1 family)
MAACSAPGGLAEGGGGSDAANGADEAGGEGVEPVVSANALAPIAALGSNEVVVTVDEMPNFGKEAALARSLRERDVTAAVFVVGERVGTVTPRDGSRYGGDVTVRTGLEAVLENGHLVANHTYSHPIQGAPKAPFNPRGCSYAQLVASPDCPGGRLQAAREVVWAQQLLLAAVNRAGPGRAGQLRKWFRPSGGSWGPGATTASFLSGQLAELANAGDPNFAGFEAPILWHVPVANRSCGATPLIRNGAIDRTVADCRAREGSLVDFECHDLYQLDPAFMPPQRCADNYVRGVAAAGRRGVVLFHGNLDTDDYSKKTIESFVDKVRAGAAGGGVTIVHPDCALGATRGGAVARGACS